MKKILSLILALAMVLSCIPFVLAEEESEIVIPDTFDFAEAFAVDYEFTGDPIVDYPSAGLTPKGSSVWQVGSYSNGSGYDTFAAYSLLNRMNSFCRAYEDDKAGAVRLDPNSTESQGKETIRYPHMVWTHHAGHTALGTDQLTYHWQGGGFTTYGDGGYAVSDPGAYTGSLGYGFGTTVTKHNSSLGYQNTGSVHPAAIFTVPKTGLLQPSITMSGSENAVWMLYKVDAEGTMTTIYPTANDMTTSIITPDPEVVVPEKWENGWLRITSGRTTRNSETIWAEEGDKIILRFAAVGPAGKGASFNLNTYTLEYLTAYETDVELEYRSDDRIVDLTDYIDLPLETSSITYDESVLSETSSNGVFTINEGYVNGTATEIVIVNGNTTQTINASFKEQIMVYDLGELFATTDTYTAGYQYPAGGQTPAVANDGSGIWTVGYYTLGEYGSPLHLFEQLVRYGATNRAYEDTASAAKDGAASMSWIMTNNNVKTDATTGLYCSDPNGSTGSIGYNFRTFTNGNSSFYGSSALGWSAAPGMIRNQAVVFKAPRAGVINPQMLLSARYANAVLYRMDKIDAEGNLTAIYPLPAESKVDWDPSFTEGAPAVPEEYVSGWAIVPNGYGATTLPEHTEGYVRVEKGDKIVLRFAPYGGGNTAYAIDYLTMTYTEQFGPDDELFTTSPMAPFEDSYTFTYPTEKVAEIVTSLANTNAQGTIEYTVTGNLDVLKATATPGVYELTGIFNVGGEAAVVTAGYYSPGKSSANGDAPRFTQTANVFVQPLSNTEATFEGGYDIFDLSEMSYEMDEAFVLPYYSNAAERAIYGVVDLGITDTWRNATVTFSDPSKFEYLGNGRIRALASHTWEQAGGVQGATDGSVAASKNGSNLTSLRDKASMGEPIVMTVTATDGGVRKFALWSFPTVVQNLSGDDANPNAYRLYPTHNTISNAVISVEGYTTDGTFIPTYKDPACGDSFSILADHRYSIQHFAPRMDGGGGVCLSMNGATNWESKSNRDWHNARGLSQTFTAPKDGTIDLTGYWPKDGYWYNAYVAAEMAKGNPVNFTVALYDADDNLIAKLWEGDYSVDSAEDTSYKLKNVTVNETYATVADDEARTLTFDVQKGQKVRVMFDFTFDQNWNAYLYFSAGQGHAPTPVWTYALDIPDEFTDYSVDVTPTADGLVAENVLTLFYNEAGELVSVSKAADDGSSEDEYFSIYLPENAEATYAKIFFWDSLGNIKPLAGNLVVRK